MEHPKDEKIRKGAVPPSSELDIKCPSLCPRILISSHGDCPTVLILRVQGMTKKPSQVASSLLPACVAIAPATQPLMQNAAAELHRKFHSHNLGRFYSVALYYVGARKWCAKHS